MNAAILVAALRLEPGARQTVTMSLGPGELALLQGPPGSGKTTLLRALAGLLRHPLASGTLRLAGQRYGPAGPCPSGVAWVQQDPYRGFLQPTVLEELASLEGAPSDHHLAGHIRALGLEPRQDPRDLSLGEAWRLGLEAALHRDPTLLLLDEPTGSLDGPGLAWMAARLRAYLDHGGCVVVAEHRPEALGTLPTQRVLLAGATTTIAPAQPCDAPCALRGGDPLLTAHALVAEPGGARRVGPLDLTLRPRERVGLSGPNGCGKTTLLRALSGLEPIDGGTLDRRRPASGFLPQRPDDLLFRPTVAAELAAAGDRCPALLGLLGLDLDPEQDPITLSHGQRLMLATATVLADAPPLVLLDEPSAWLDGPGEARLFGALDHLQRHHGSAVLVASHDPALLARHCDRVVTMPAARSLARARQGEGPEAPSRSDAGVLAVLGLGLAAMAVVAATQQLPLLWAELAALLCLVPTTPRWRRSLRRVAKRGATLLLASSSVLCLLRGWPDGLALGLLATGKALGAWLPAAIALRSVRRADLRRLLIRVAGPRLGLAATLCISAAPLVERVAARAWELARLRRLRSPLAVLVPVLLRILTLADALADMVSLRSARPLTPDHREDRCPAPND